MVLINGKEIAAGVHADLTRRAAALAAKGITPCMAIILVGTFEPSAIYVKNKRKAAEQDGIKTILHHLPESTDTQTLLNLLAAIANDPAIHGVMTQMPMPAHVDTDAVLAAIPPAKDVDGLSPLNLGRLMAGGKCFIPATPQGCLLLIKSVTPNIKGKHAVVIGRSRVVGKPMAQLLVAENCTVTIAHSHTVDLAAICRSADILIAATGQPRMIKGDWVKQGAIVIDVGITRQDDGLVGDVDFAAASVHAGAITPVPRGVGPMTIACLLKNTVIAAEAQQA